MELLIALALAVAFSWTSRNAIRKAPSVFYALAIAVDVVFLGNVLWGVLPGIARVADPLVQRCLLAYGIFAVVMFVGVLPSESKLRRQLAPVRGELSIVASILAIGHVANYAQSYLALGLEGLAGLPGSLMLSFAVSSVLVVMLSVLAATSAGGVRRAMDCAMWKKVQLLAYPFFGLIFVHITLALAPSVSFVGQKAFLSVAIYAGVTLLYIALRMRRARFDRKVSQK